MPRRTVVRGLVLGGAAVVLAACSGSSGGRGSSGAESGPAPEPSSREGAPRVLLAFFSRPGENYYYGDRTDLDVGNTKVLAGMIADRIGCDVHEILASDTYPESYDDCVARNTREKESGARPEIANDIPDIAGHDIVLLASPVWSSRAPMIMSTFAEALDLRGKTVHPVVTYAVSGLASTASDYAELCPGSTIGEGLAVQGEEVGDAGAQLASWLRSTGLRRV